MYMTCRYLRLLSIHSSWWHGWQCNWKRHGLQLCQRKKLCNALQRTATHCNALQRTATHCNTLQRTATHCIALQCTANSSNTLQHKATQGNNDDDCFCCFKTQFSILVVRFICSYTYRYIFALIYIYVYMYIYTFTSSLAFLLWAFFAHILSCCVASLGAAWSHLL